MLAKTSHTGGGWKKGMRRTWITTGSTTNASKSIGSGVISIKNMRNTGSTGISREQVLLADGGDSVSAVGVFGL
jgi:hypothetical protein